MDVGAQGRVCRTGCCVQGRGRAVGVQAGEGCVEQGAGTLWAGGGLVVHAWVGSLIMRRELRGLVPSLETKGGAKQGEVPCVCV